MPIVRLAPGSSLRRLRSDRAGAAAVEFAMVSPFVLVMLLFLMSTGYILFMGQALDFATQKAARQIRIGTVQTSQYSQSDFRTRVVCPLLPSMFTCNNVIVNIQAVNTNDGNYPNEYYNFVNSSQNGLIIPQLSNSSTSYCPGQQTGYVYVQILYPIPLILSPLAIGATSSVVFNGQNVFLIMATATILNEPFNAPASSC